MVAVAILSVRIVTYTYLDSHLGAEHVRAKLLHLEDHARCALYLDYFSSIFEFAAKLERLRRRTVLVEDRTARLALEARRQLFQAELHYREGITRYEGLAWPHLTLHLFELLERYHRRALRKMAAVEWCSLEQQVARTVAFCTTMAGFMRKKLAAERGERRERGTMKYTSFC